MVLFHPVTIGIDGCTFRFVNGAVVVASGVTTSALPGRTSTQHHRDAFATTMFHHAAASPPDALLRPKLACDTMKFA